MLSLRRAGAPGEARHHQTEHLLYCIAGLVGLEMYGVGGALVLEVYATLAVAVLAELAKRREEAARAEVTSPAT